MTHLETFRGRFHFNAAKAQHVGVERECLVIDCSGRPVPYAESVLTALWAKHPDHKDSFGYELSACQLEHRTRPILIDNLTSDLCRLEREASTVLRGLNLSAQYEGIGPSNMSTDVYPDPDGRYARLVKKMPKEKLLWACRLIGTHVHVGMPDADTALTTYNRVIKKLNELIELGDTSNGARILGYQCVAPTWKPRPYIDWNDFHKHAESIGFDEDLRENWALIRISRYGTIEFRMFGGTRSAIQVGNWARQCVSLCRDAI